jgi:hypothetical protein
MRLEKTEVCIAHSIPTPDCVSDDHWNANSGDTITVENAYDANVATFFKRASEHKGMLEMISPQDGTLQAIVEICGIGK